MCIVNCLTLLLRNWSSHFPSLSLYSTLHLPPLFAFPPNILFWANLTLSLSWEDKSQISPLPWSERKKIASIFPLPFDSEFNSHTRMPPAPRPLNATSISLPLQHPPKTSFCLDTCTSSPSIPILKLQFLMRRFLFVRPSHLYLSSLLQSMSVSFPSNNSSLLSYWNYVNFPPPPPPQPLLLCYHHSVFRIVHVKAT
jgi:hypothetical protein